VNSYKEVYVAIVQPRAPFDERITIACYTPEDIGNASDQISEIINNSNREGAPLIPGEEQCRYCRAKLICPAFRETMTVPAVITPDKALSVEAREAFLQQKLAELNDEQLDKVLMACALAEMIEAPAKDETRKRIKEGGMTNFSLAKDSEVREIVNVRRAMSLLSLAGFERSDLFECVTHFSISKLEEKLRKKNPNWTWKQAKEWTNKKLQSVIATETRKGKLIRK
jgi:hypothetical protein